MNAITRFSLLTAATILCLAARLHAQTWTGGVDTLVNTAGNWSSLPAFDGTESIIIGTGGSAISLNQSIAVDGITFNRDLGAVFSLTRPGTETLTLGSGGVTVNSGLTAGTQFYLNTPLTLAGSTSFTSNFGTGTDANTAGLRLIGIDGPSNSTLTFGGSGHTWQYGSVTGSNLTITKNDAGTLTFQRGYRQ